MGMDSDAIHPSDVIAAFRGTAATLFFDPSTGQLSPLITPRKPGLIENAKLRAQIADWPSLVAEPDVEREMSLTDRITGYRTRLVIYLPSGDNGAFDNRFDELLADRQIHSDLHATRRNVRRSIREGPSFRGPQPISSR
jgi:hypothetical protein